MQYALIWWATFAVIEIGQAIAPDYSCADALGGILAEVFHAGTLGAANWTPA